MEESTHHGLYDSTSRHVSSTTAGPTLLPSPVASFVSFLTQSTSLSLRIGTCFGGAVLDGARVTTLTGLEFSRALIEGVLIRAGRDVGNRSAGERGKAEAESLLERSLATLHSTVTSTSFFAAATFDLSSTALSSVSHVSQALLSTLDAVLGPSETSRAIASIITIIRRELRSSDLLMGEGKVGVGDLLLGCVGFALLQRWGRRNTAREIQANGGEELIWDVVILDNGIRADVVGMRKRDLEASMSTRVQGRPKRTASFISLGEDEERFDAVARGTHIFSGPNRPQSRGKRKPGNTDDEMRAYIMEQLPQGCRVSINTELVTTRTITVDIYDDESTDILPPPGVIMVEERFHHEQDYAQVENLPGQLLPKHTVIFRTAFNSSQSADLNPQSQSNKPCPSELDSRDRDVSTNIDALEPAGRTQHRLDHKRALPNDIEEKLVSHRSSSRAVSLNGPDSDARLTSISPPTCYPDNLSTSLDRNPENQKGLHGKGSFSIIKRKEVTEKVRSSKKPTRLPSVIHTTVSSSTADVLQLGKSSSAPNFERKTTGKAKHMAATIKPNSKAKRSEPYLLKARTSPPVIGEDLQKLPPLHAQDSKVRDAVLPTLYDTCLQDAHPSDIQVSDYDAVFERRRESCISRKGSSSPCAMDSHSYTVSNVVTHARSGSSISITRSDIEGAVSSNDDDLPAPSRQRNSSISFTQSIYSLATAGSETSLVLAHRPRRSVYDDLTTIQALNRHGIVPGIFPERHFVENIRLFCRFSSASYGSNALKVMGVQQTTNALRQVEFHDNYEHSAFSNHAGLPPSTILLSSYVDPAGGSNAAGETDSGFPLVHYLCLDHESKAVVLTLRGTWGFEDVLTDITCDYDDLEWQGKNWKVHKGIHASARRLLEGEGGRVMITIKAALEEFTDYGVILCGHSLGGGVAALLAVMISAINCEATGPSFVTASYQPFSRQTSPDTLAFKKSLISLPPDRPIHVYAYGPPAVMSSSLRRATRGLITTIVNGQDVVPSLSLGILHDLHFVASAFKSDISGAKSHVRGRVWEALRQSVINKFYVNQPPILMPAGDGIGEDAWAWKALKLLRKEMRATKLMPPGEVFIVETMRVLQRDAFTADTLGDGYPRLGRPATRAQLKLIRNVEARFGELRFGSGMLSDHNPARYEASLAALAQGLLDD